MTGNSIPPRRKASVEIPLHSVRKYVPGSGPPPPRISLVPPRDSTAYIIDQFVLPTDKDLTPTSRRLIHYHIGFTDLPAVKILIPCNKVLDYVSPRELEDWEYQNLEHKEQERARRLAEQQRAGPTKKKPGQPSKVPLEDIGMPRRNSVDEALLLAQHVAGPSLSTPKKRKLGHIPDEAEVADSNAESDDAAIYRQLQGDPELDDEVEEFDDDLESDSESVDQLALQYDASAPETPSRTESLGPPLKAPLPANSNTAVSEKGSPSSTPAASTLPPSNTSTPGVVHPAWAHAFGQKSRPEQPQMGHRHNEHALRHGMPLSLLSKPQHPKPSTPIGARGTTFKIAGSSNGATSQLSTSGIGATPPNGAGSSAHKRKGQPNGKGSPQEKQQTTKKPKLQQEVEPAADEWEVKDLLDDRWSIEQGVRVHRYLVLWAGDWPEDQNPTWEPAENVQDRDLIKRYQKRKKAGLVKPAQKKQKTLHRYLAGAKYASVAEAFEGGIDDQAGPAAADVESDDVPDETFLVTANVGDVMANTTRAPLASFGSFDTLLERYNQNFPRG